MTISCYLIHHRDVAESEHDHNYENYILSPDGTLEKGVTLLFLPLYSPHLHLIDRLWKFVKKNALYNKYYSDFKAFKEGIDNCLNDIKDKYRDEIKSLMTLNFQIIQNPKL